MTAATEAWAPPEGMSKPLAATWRAFYRTILNQYGVTPQFYRQMYLAQSGRCYICRRAKGIHPDDPKGGGVRRLGIDHDHMLGNRIEAVRGLLCTGSLSANTCNRLIARYSATQLERATAYLSTPPAQVLRQMLYTTEVMHSGPLTDAELTGILT